MSQSAILVSIQDIEIFFNVFINVLYFVQNDKTDEKVFEFVFGNVTILVGISFLDVLFSIIFLLRVLFSLLPFIFPLLTLFCIIFIFGLGFLLSISLSGFLSVDFHVTVLDTGFLSEGKG